MNDCSVVFIYEYNHFKRFSVSNRDEKHKCSLEFLAHFGLRVNYLTSFSEVF